MTTRPTSFRLSQETLARLRALAQPHEPAAQVIARALLALEAQDAAQDSSAAPPPGSALAQRLAALEARLAALEAPSVSTAPVASPRSPTSAGSPHSRPDYPPEVRRLAVQLADDGVQPGEIRQRIAEACGRAPDSKNIGKLIRHWREQQDSA